MVNLKTNIILLNQNKKCYFDIKFRIVNSLRYKELHLMYFKSVKTYFCVRVNGSLLDIFSACRYTNFPFKQKHAYNGACVEYLLPIPASTDAF